MSSPSNHDRALWALEACKTFGNLTGQHYAHDLNEIIGDLIANLLHLANENDIDPMDRLANALGHFTEEVAEEEEEVA
jgi:methanogenic corrinoid protein MtbC1